MNSVSIVNIINDLIPINKKITIKGWVKTRRTSKSGISFISIYDGSSVNTIQIIADNKLINYHNEILKITTGCSVIITGKLIVSPGKKQKYEIYAELIKIAGWVSDPETYPISSKKHTMSYLREVAHLRPRTNLIGVIARIRHTLFYEIHNFFNKNGYFWVATPIITSSNTEGGGEMFRVSMLDNNSKNQLHCFKKDFFGRESFLTVSGQLNGEAYASALSKIYTFGPVFRAENSNTRRHLAEFWMVEPELAYADLNDIINLSEKLIQYLFKKVLEKRLEDMNYIKKNIEKNAINRLEKIILNKFVQIEYDEAIEILLKSKKIFEKKISWGTDLMSEHERFLTEECFHSPLVVKNYPSEIKAFYMRLNNDKKTVSSMDILFPTIGEIIGGSQREERLDILDYKIKQAKLNKKDYWWYRDLRKYGTVKHSGFGLGFERLVAYITGVKNIKDTIPFPRTSKNITF